MKQQSNGVAVQGAEEGKDRKTWGVGMTRNIQERDAEYTRKEKRPYYVIVPDIQRKTFDFC